MQNQLNEIRESIQALGTRIDEIKSNVDYLNRRLNDQDDQLEVCKFFKFKLTRLKLSRFCFKLFIIRDWPIIDLVITSLSSEFLIAIWIFAYDFWSSRISAIISVDSQKSEQCLGSLGIHAFSVSPYFKQLSLKTLHSISE